MSKHLSPPSDDQALAVLKTTALMVAQDPEHAGLIAATVINIIAAAWGDEEGEDAFEAISEIVYKIRPELGVPTLEIEDATLAAHLVRETFGKTNLTMN